MEATTDRSEETQKPRIFLSYSRRDIDFTRRLAEALTRLGYVADFDQSEYDPANVITGISAEDDWWKRLQEMIAAAEAMVLIVSPNSAASQVCGEEIAYARVLGKRVIPVLLHEIDFTKAPPRLAALNVKLSFVDEATFDASLASLHAVLAVDVAWYREGARLSALAVTWDSENRPVTRLLSASAVNEAEVWAARRPANAPPHGEPLTSFLFAAREKADAERERLRTVTGHAFHERARTALNNGRQDSALRFIAAGMLLTEDFELQLIPEQFPLLAESIISRRLMSVLVCGVEELIYAAFIPGGDRALVVSKCGKIFVWDIRTGQTHQKFEIKATLINALLSADGVKLALSDADGSVHLWDMSAARREWIYSSHGYVVQQMCFSPDRRRLAAVGDEDWVERSTHDPKTGKFQVTKRTSFRPARILDVDTGAELTKLEGHAGVITNVDFSPAGDFVVTASQDETARIWNSLTGRLLKCLRGHKDTVTAARFDPGGRVIVTASDDKTLRLWDGRSGRQRKVLNAHRTSVVDARFSPDGKTIVSVARASFDFVRFKGWTPDAPRIWDARTGKLRGQIIGHSADINSADFSADGTLVITASDDGTVKLWSVEESKEIGTLATCNAWASNAISSGDGKLVMSLHGDGATRIWTTERRREPRIFRVEGRDCMLRTARLSCDGRKVAALTMGGGIHMWDVHSGEALFYIKEDLGDWGRLDFK